MGCRGGSMTCTAQLLQGCSSIQVFSHSKILYFHQHACSWWQWLFIVLTVSRSAIRNTHMYKHIQCKCSYLDTLWHTYTHTYIHKCIYVWLCRHINTCTHIQTHTHTHTHSSYLTVIGVHEMHGRVYPNYCHITILFIGLPYDDPLFPCNWQFAFKNFGC